MIRQGCSEVPSTSNIAMGTLLVGLDAQALEPAKQLVGMLAHLRHSIGGTNRNQYERTRGSTF